MIRHNIDDDLDAKGMGMLQHRIKIRQRAQLGIHIPIVGYIITTVDHGRGVKGTQPDSIHTKISQIFQPTLNASQVPYAVVIGIPKGPRINLVDDGRPPPVRIMHVIYCHDFQPFTDPSSMALMKYLCRKMNSIIVGAMINREPAFKRTTSVEY